VKEEERTVEKAFVKKEKASTERTGGKASLKGENLAENKNRGKGIVQIVTITSCLN